VTVSLDPKGGVIEKVNGGGGLKKKRSKMTAVLYKDFLDKNKLMFFNIFYTIHPRFVIDQAPV
jgi:hypothetical protein